MTLDLYKHVSALGSVYRLFRTFRKLDIPSLDHEGVFPDQLIALRVRAYVDRHVNTR